jgi:hypothetical protein
MAAGESPPTTKLYDRTEDEITLDEVERMLFERTPVQPIIDGYSQLHRGTRDSRQERRENDRM